MKKRSKKKAVSADVKTAKGETAKEDKPQKAFDFGGLPDRNLKKNLGC
jgi:hypothetical protein